MFCSIIWGEEVFRQHVQQVQLMGNELFEREDLAALSKDEFKELCLTKGWEVSQRVVADVKQMHLSLGYILEGRPSIPLRPNTFG